MSKVYTVKWTTPHCVLALRLIGLAFDIYDGKQKTVSSIYILIWTYFTNDTIHNVWRGDKFEHYKDISA